MASLGVSEAEIEESFVRSGGHGRAEREHDIHLRDCLCASPYRFVGQMPGNPATGTPHASSPAVCCSTQIEGEAEKVLWGPHSETRSSAHPARQKTETFPSRQGADARQTSPIARIRKPGRGSHRE